MRIQTLAVAALCALLMSFPAVAQEQVTVVKRDSTRFSGRFEAWSRQNNQIYVRVTQNDQRKVLLGDVLLFEVGGSAENLPAAETEAARGGEHVLVLTSGEIIRGRLVNIEGGEGSDTPSEPRVVSFKPSSGNERRARMSEVRRMYFGNYPQAAAAAAAASRPPRRRAPSASPPTSAGCPRDWSCRAAIRCSSSRAAKSCSPATPKTRPAPRAPCADASPRVRRCRRRWPAP